MNPQNIFRNNVAAGHDGSGFRFDRASGTNAYQHTCHGAPKDINKEVDNPNYFEVSNVAHSMRTGVWAEDYCNSTKDQTLSMTVYMTFQFGAQLGGNCAMQHVRNSSFVSNALSIWVGARNRNLITDNYLGFDVPGNEVENSITAGGPYDNTRHFWFRNRFGPTNMKYHDVFHGDGHTYSYIIFADNVHDTPALSATDDKVPFRVTPGTYVNNIVYDMDGTMTKSGSLMTSIFPWPTAAGLEKVFDQTFQHGTPQAEWLVGNLPAHQRTVAKHALFSTVRLWVPRRPGAVPNSDWEIQITNAKGELMRTSQPVKDGTASFTAPDEGRIAWYQEQKGWGFIIGNLVNSPYRVASMALASTIDDTTISIQYVSMFPGTFVDFGITQLNKIYATKPFKLTADNGIPVSQVQSAQLVASAAQYGITYAFIKNNDGSVGLVTKAVASATEFHLNWNAVVVID